MLTALHNDYSNFGRLAMMTEANVGDYSSVLQYFATNYEKTVDHTNGTTREINYINTPYGTLAAFIKEGNNAGQMYYLYKDHLGSITHITNSSGAVEETRSFDAWGRMRNPTDWTYNNVPKMTILDRGYTGHEHLPLFGLINMNGRMYDPLIGRMLSPDPYTHGIAGTQGFNRYSYALNNPLKFTDPSGENPILAGAMLVAVMFGFSTAISDIRNNTITPTWQYLGHMAVGAVAGALGAGIGAGAVGFLEGVVYGAAAGAASGFVGGAGSAWVRGASTSEIFRQGFRSAAICAAISAATNGISGFLKAKRLGLDPMTGKGTMEVVSETGGLYDNAQAISLGESYDNSVMAKDTDVYLSVRLQDNHPDIGRYKLKEITTKTGGGEYGLLPDGNYLNTETGGVVPAYTRHTFGGKPVELHISPYVTNADDIVFKAFTGHEMIHIRHLSTITGFFKPYSESIAYNQTYKTFMDAGRWQEALQIRSSAIRLGHWEILYPANYGIWR